MSTLAAKRHTAPVAKPRRHQTDPKLTFQLSPDLERRIREQAKREDRSASSLVRRAVMAYLETAEPKA